MKLCCIVEQENYIKRRWFSKKKRTPNGDDIYVKTKKIAVKSRGRIRKVSVNDFKVVGTNPSYRL